MCDGFAMDVPSTSFRGWRQGFVPGPEIACSVEEGCRLHVTFKPCAAWFAGWPRDMWRRSS